MFSRDFSANTPHPTLPFVICRKILIFPTGLNRIDHAAQRKKAEIIFQSLLQKQLVKQNCEIETHFFPAHFPLTAFAIRTQQPIQCQRYPISPVDDFHTQWNCIHFEISQQKSGCARERSIYEGVDGIFFGLKQNRSTSPVRNYTILWWAKWISDTLVALWLTFDFFYIEQVVLYVVHTDACNTHRWVTLIKAETTIWSNMRHGQNMIYVHSQWPTSNLSISIYWRKSRRIPAIVPMI